VVADVDADSQEVLIADVHPMKYGAFWTVTFDRLFDAMVDRDGTSFRARGMIHMYRPDLGRSSGLSEISKGIFWPSDITLLQLPRVDLFDFSGVHNIQCAAAVTKAFNLLGRELTLDGVMQELKISPTQYLNRYLSEDLMLAYCKALGSSRGLQAKLLPLGGISSGAELVTTVNAAIQGGAVALLRFDINTALDSEVVQVAGEAAKLSKGSNHAAVCVRAQEGELCLMGSAGMVTGSFWRCDADGMLKAIRTRMDGGNAVVLGGI